MSAENDQADVLLLCNIDNLLGRVTQNDVVIGPDGGVRRQKALERGLRSGPDLRVIVVQVIAAGGWGFHMQQQNLGAAQPREQGCPVHPDTGGGGEVRREEDRRFVLAMRRELRPLRQIEGLWGVRKTIDSYHRTVSCLRMK